jgi:beta-glucanase (GH16 family)
MRVRYVLLAVLASMPVAARAADFAPVVKDCGAGVQFLWGDEFEGASLDARKWEIRTGKRKGGYWVEENVRLDGGGNLIIETKKDRDGRFTTGAIWTKGRMEHRYGLWEIRAKFPGEEGHWGAFWLFAESVRKARDHGRDGTEIDVVEKPWKGAIQHALHWGGYHEKHRVSEKKVNLNKPEYFHVFSLCWEPESYRFFVDGRETWRTSDGGVSQVPQFIQITDEVGKWAGRIENAKLPDQFVVDYVRFFSFPH